MTTLDFEGNPMTDAGMKAMADAMHAAGLETNEWTPAAVKDELAELRAGDNDQTAALFKVLAEIGEELGKTETTVVDRSGEVGLEAARAAAEERGRADGIAAVD